MELHKLLRATFLVNSLGNVSLELVKQSFQLKLDTWEKFSNQIVKLVKNVMNLKSLVKVDLNLAKIL